MLHCAALCGSPCLWLKEQQDFKADNVPYAVTFVLQVGTAVVFCLGCGGMMCEILLQQGRGSTFCHTSATLAHTCKHKRKLYGQSCHENADRNIADPALSSFPLCVAASDSNKKLTIL